MATLARYPDEALPQERIPPNSRWGIWLSTLQRLLNLAAQTCGTVTLAGGTATVTFTELQPDTSYRVALGGNADERFRWGSKTTSGFVITSSNGASTAIVDWISARI